MTMLVAKAKTHLRELPLVLAVDDSPVQLRLIQDALTRNGYAVKTAPSSEEALAMLTVVVPAVIISDVMMSGMSGYELCQQLKRDENLRRIPILRLFNSLLMTLSLIARRVCTESISCAV